MDNEADDLEPESFEAALVEKFRATHGIPNRTQLAAMQMLVKELVEERRRAGKDPFRECFFGMMQLTCARLQIPLEECPDPYRLGCELAAVARSHAELEVAKMLACRGFPSGPNFEQFMRKRYKPKLDELFGQRLRACQECFTIFFPTDRRNVYCSPQCSARPRNRDRQKVGNGKSAAENAIARREQWWKRHKPKCSDCRTGRVCETAETKLQMMGRLPSSADVTPEEAQAIMQRAGRTPKRATEPAPRRSRKALTGSR